MSRTVGIAGLGRQTDASTAIVTGCAAISRLSMIPVTFSTASQRLDHDRIDPERRLTWSRAFLRSRTLANFSATTRRMDPIDFQYLSSAKIRSLLVPRVA